MLSEDVALNGLVVALALVAIALTLERLYLRSQRRKLRIADQTFRFHKLRDELQLLAIDGRLEVKSRLYDFLITMLNLGIRNPDTLRASQMVQLAKSVTRDCSKPTHESFVQQVKMYDHEIQMFVGTCFYEFSRMLMFNDPLYLAWQLLSNGSKKIVRGTLGLDTRLRVIPIVEATFPQSAETIRAAAEYRAIGDDLCLI